MKNRQLKIFRNKDLLILEKEVNQFMKHHYIIDEKAHYVRDIDYHIIVLTYFD